MRILTYDVTPADEGRAVRVVVPRRFSLGNHAFRRLKALGAIRVDRDVFDFSFLRKSEEILEKGGVVEVFPESRLPAKGEEKPLVFKPSVAYLALHSGAPVIPVYHTGNYFRKSRVGVMIGKPVDVREWYDDSLPEKENLENISAKLRERIIELGNEFQRQTQKEIR